jgi:hypothetical protein
MKPDDQIEVEVLPDGTIKCTTNKISAANHSSAEGFMAFLARLTGGETTITKRSAHTHTHAHEKAKESV